MARTNNVSNYLSDVANAIKTKKGNNTPIPASNFDTEINNLKTLNDCYNDEMVDDFLNTVRENTAVINSDAKGKSVLLYAIVKKIPYIELDFSNISNQKLIHALEWFWGLEEIDVSGWDVHTITTFRSIFFMCYNLKRLDCSAWTTTSATAITVFCKGCRALEWADLSCFNGAFAIGEMCVGCTSLQHLDIRGLDLVNSTGVVQSSSGNCFLGSNTAQAVGGGWVPSDCEIIVADQTQKDYMASQTGWLDRFTNVKTVAEYEAE